MKLRLMAGLSLWLLIVAVSGAAAGRTITDGIGRKVEIPAKVERLIASGSGALRLITYLQAQDRIVAVDDMEKRLSCFVGGIAHRGPHGFQSTEPGYPPYTFVCARNLTIGSSLKEKARQHSNIAKEKIVEWNPDILFVDLSTLQMGANAGALYELKTDPACRSLTAVKTGKVYGLLPYNWYTRNFRPILANAYFIGKMLYPDRFGDINPAAKADEIYPFFYRKRWY